MIINDYTLRAKMSSDILVHERTIQRWAKNNNPKLALKGVLSSFKVNSGVKASQSELIEEVELNNETSLKVA